MRRSWGLLCDLGVGAFLDSPIHRAESASVRKAARPAVTGGGRRGSTGPVLRPAAGRLGAARRRVLAHQSDSAATCPAVRGVQVGGGSDRGPHGATAGTASASDSVTALCSSWTGRWCRRVIIKVAEQPKNCGYSTNRQVAVDVDPCVVVASAARFRATATSARRGPSRVPRGRWAGRPPSPTVATGGPD